MPLRLVLVLVLGFVGFCAVMIFLYAPLTRWLIGKTTNNWIKDFDRKMSIAESGSEFENEIRAANKGN